ncbi:MAG: DUF692 domain-containing protein [Cyanobacteria bacterium P01_H01_bin.74]
MSTTIDNTLDNNNIRGPLGTPVLGVGLGLRSDFKDTLYNYGNYGYAIDWLEFTPENYMGNTGLMARNRLQKAARHFPMVSHGVSLSIGGSDPISKQYLTDLKEIFAEVRPHWFSDHLCFSTHNGQYFNDLLPLPKTQKTATHVADRIKAVQDCIQLPFLIENISYYVNTPYDALSDAAFVTMILEKADCGLLLDVNNVYVNACNFKTDPIDFLQAIPLDRVVQLHVAGHQQFTENGETTLIDTHGATVCPDVWALLRWVLMRCQPSGVLLERDTNMPAFEDLMAELHTIHRIWQETQSHQGQGQSHDQAQGQANILKFNSAKNSSNNLDYSENFENRAKQNSQPAISQANAKPSGGTDVVSA